MLNSNFRIHGVSDAEFSKKSSDKMMTLVEHVGITKNGTFYPTSRSTLILSVYKVLTLMIDDKIAEDILQLDIFSGLPLLGISNLTLCLLQVVATVAQNYGCYEYCDPAQAVGSKGHSNK